MKTTQAKNEIITLLSNPVNLINGNDGINAREVHRLLKVGRDYSKWIKARIKQANFIENQDYITIENLAVDLPKSANKNTVHTRLFHHGTTQDIKNTAIH